MFHVEHSRWGMRARCFRLMILRRRLLCASVLWMVRQVESLVKSGVRPPKPRPARPVDPNVRRLEEELQRALGTRVRIRSGGKSGRIEISFSSPDEFDGIVARLLDERLLS